MSDVGHQGDGEAKRAGRRGGEAMCTLVRFAEASCISTLRKAGESLPAWVGGHLDLFVVIDLRYKRSSERHLCRLEIDVSTVDVSLRLQMTSDDISFKAGE